MAESRQPLGSLNKRGLAEALAKRLDVSQDKADAAVDGLFEICAQKVSQGLAVSISNFGTFERINRPSRYARNPQNGERMAVPARNSVRFVVSPRLNEYANSDTPEEEVTIRKRPKGPSKN